MGRHVAARRPRRRGGCPRLVRLEQTSRGEASRRRLRARPAFRPLEARHRAGLRGPRAAPLRRTCRAARTRRVCVGVCPLGRLGRPHLGRAFQLPLAALRERRVLARAAQQSLPRRRAGAHRGAARPRARHAHPSRSLGREDFPRRAPVPQSPRRHRGDASLDERLRTARRPGQRQPRRARATDRQRLAPVVRRLSVALAGQSLPRAHPDLPVVGVRV
ncbi:MAG: hypothetical protein BWX86_02755 [Verrucomicrobia bacterium ADurb.Bin122]|nr:MAG: hypothetical protein BWX86_02755 [Verrucomicrobia bacterium ADurb.Bin122]